MAVSERKAPSSAGNNGFASACASLTGITCSIFVDDMRLYLGSGIINRLPFRWQSGESLLALRQDVPPDQ